MNEWKVILALGVAVALFIGALVLGDVFTARQRCVAQCAKITEVNQPACLAVCAR